MTGMTGVLERVIVLLALVALVVFMSWAAREDAQELRSQMSQLQSELLVIRGQGCP